MLQDALELVPEAMNDTGVIIAENPLDEEILSNYGDFVLDRQYRYGKIKITIQYTEYGGRNNGSTFN